MARAAVIGVGLIGASLAAALERRGTAVCGYDPVPGRTSQAMRLGLLAEEAPTLEAACADADFVIVAAPVGAIVALLPDIDSFAHPSALVLDTGSAKRSIVTAMERVGGGNRMVGGHPVAGKDASGPAYAEPDLFRSRPFVLTPSPITSEKALSAAVQLATDIGARPLVMSAEEHDRLLATTSHLPQLLSSVLAGMIGDPALDVAGTGLRDMTRLARSDPAMWRDILLSNGDNIARALRRYAGQLERCAAAIDRGAAEEVEVTLREGREAALRVAERVAA